MNTRDVAGRSAPPLLTITMMQGGAAVCTSALGAPHHMDMDMDMDMGTALHAFEATEATHIALSCGQRVRIIEERDDGWSYGEAETGERGTFPTSYVQADGGTHAEMSLAPKLPRSDSFTTIASRRATLPSIAAAQSIGQGLRGHLARTLSSTHAARLPDVSPWDSVSCFSGAQEEPELRPLGDAGGSGLGLTSDEVANLLGSIELNNAEQLQHWARTEPITGGDLEQLLFLERAEADAILLNAGLSSALHRRRLLSQVQGWSQCGVPPRLIESSPGYAHAMPQAAPTPQMQWQKPAEAPAVPADAVAVAAALAAPGEWSIDEVTVSTFSKMFADACTSQGPGTDRLGKAEAGPVLAMSGLPTETLLQIWSLADVDDDDRLDLRGFLLCCWLVQRSVQRQLPPPASLPPELLASATAAVAPMMVLNSTEAQPTEPPSTKPQPMPPATPVGENEFGFDSGGFGEVAGAVAAAKVAAEKAAVMAGDLQPRLQIDQLTERLVAARAAAAVEAQRALAVVDSVAGALAELEVKQKEERPVNDASSQVAIGVRLPTGGDEGCSHAERMRGLVVSVKEEGPEAPFVVEGAPLREGGGLRELEPQPTLPPIRPSRASTASPAASPGASLSRQVTSGTTSTPARVSTHVTQQLFLMVLSESARSLPDKPLRSVTCLFILQNLHDCVPSVHPSAPCPRAYTVDVPTRLC